MFVSSKPISNFTPGIVASKPCPVVSRPMSSMCWFVKRAAVCAFRSAVPSCISAEGERPEEPPLRGDGGCVNLCLEDPLPEPVDCAIAEEGVEFYPTPIWDFDTQPGIDENGIYSALTSNGYSYSDGTQDFM